MGLFQPIFKFISLNSQLLKWILIWGTKCLKLQYNDFNFIIQTKSNFKIYIFEGNGVTVRRMPNFLNFFAEIDYRGVEFTTTY